MNNFLNSKNILFSMLLLTIIIVSGCSDQSDTSDNEGEEAYNLSLATETADDHSFTIAANKFAESVEEDSDGRLTIDVFPNGELGGGTETLEQLQLGDLDMAVNGGPAHAPIVPEMSIVNLPFAFDTREEAYDVIDGELGEIQFDLLEENGIKGLSWWEDGFFQITTNTGPIETPDDMKGVKIRVPEIEIRQDTFKALGANPVPMSFTELFSALQQNVVDGQTNGLSTVYSSNFYEVQDYLSIIPVTWSSAVLEISSDKWDSLPKDLQDILQENADEYRDFQRELTQEEDEELVSKLEDEGMDVNEVDDLTPFKEKTETVYEEYEDVFGKDLMDLMPEN